MMNKFNTQVTINVASEICLAENQIRAELDEIANLVAAMHWEGKAAKEAKSAVKKIKNQVGEVCVNNMNTMSKYLVNSVTLNQGDFENKNISLSQNFK